MSFTPAAKKVSSRNMQSNALMLVLPRFTPSTHKMMPIGHTKEFLRMAASNKWLMSSAAYYLDFLPFHCLSPSPCVSPLTSR